MQIVTAITSHTGFEELQINGKNRLNMREFFINCIIDIMNVTYGSSETHWDQKFGRFHDGTPQATEDMNGRRRVIYSPV